MLEGRPKSQKHKVPWHRCRESSCGLMEADRSTQMRDCRWATPLCSPREVGFLSLQCTYYSWPAQAQDVLCTCFCLCLARGAYARISCIYIILPSDWQRVITSCRCVSRLSGIFYVLFDYLLHPPSYVDSKFAIHHTAYSD
jgi:hypothetical protein